jgi:hypothetical protein
MCSHLLHDSHCTIGRPSSDELQTQRVLSVDRLLRSVDGVVRPPSVLVAGDALNEFGKGSYRPCGLVFVFMSADACAQRWLCALRVF